MKTPTLQSDLSTYTITIPHDPLWPDLPRRQMELALHHVQTQAEDSTYRQIEDELGLTRDQVVHEWLESDRTSVCTFTRMPVDMHWNVKPGISVVPT